MTTPEQVEVMSTRTIYIRIHDLETNLQAARKENGELRAEIRELLEFKESCEQHAMDVNLIEDAEEL